MKKGQAPKQQDVLTEPKEKSEKNDEEEMEDEKEGSNEEGEGEDGDGEKKQKSSTDPETTKEGPSGDGARKDSRDKRTLFLKNLPGNCTVKLIKAVAKEARQVRIRNTFSIIDGKRKRIGYAYVEFASEEVAEKYFKILDGAIIKASKISVDYVGAKSSYQTNKLKSDPGDIDPLRLYVTGLPADATDEDLLTLFPEAVDVVLPKRKKDKKLFGYGFIGFPTAELAKQYHDKGQGELTFKDNKLTVLYAKRKKGISDQWKDSGRQKQDKDTEPAAKKAKKETGDAGDNSEEDDDDDDDDDDSE